MKLLLFFGVVLVTTFTFAQNLGSNRWFFNPYSYLVLEESHEEGFPFRFYYNSGSYFSGAEAKVEGNRLILHNPSFETDATDEESVLYRNLISAQFELTFKDANQVELKPLDVGAMVILDECQLALPAKDTKTMHDLGFMVQYNKELKAAKTTDKRKAVVKKWRDKYGLNVEKAVLTNAAVFAEPLKENDQLIDSLVYTTFEIQGDSVFFRDFTLNFSNQQLIVSNWHTSLANASALVKGKAKKNAENPIEVDVPVVQDEALDPETIHKQIVPSYRDSIVGYYNGQWIGKMEQVFLKEMNMRYAAFGPSKQTYKGDENSMRFLGNGYGQGKMRVYSNSKAYDYYLFQFNTPVLFEEFESYVLTTYDKLRNVNSLPNVNLSSFSFRVKE